LGSISRTIEQNEKVLVGLGIHGGSRLRENKVRNCEQEEQNYVDEGNSGNIFHKPSRLQDIYLTSEWWVLLG
jgi:hypothetical protein